jgi:hypothetical protein
MTTGVSMARRRARPSISGACATTLSPTPSPTCGPGSAGPAIGLPRVVTRETVIRAARPGDEARLAELFGRVYGKPMSLERWRWKLGRWDGTVPNVWLAEHDGAPICQYAGMPTAVRLEGRDATLMVAVDAMTAPEHRRQGLLTEVVRQAHEAWRLAGILSFSGLPNEQWGAGPAPRSGGRCSVSAGSRFRCGPRRSCAVATAPWWRRDWVRSLLPGSAGRLVPILPSRCARWRGPGLPSTCSGPGCGKARACRSVATRPGSRGASSPRSRTTGAARREEASTLGWSAFRVDGSRGLRRAHRGPGGRPFDPAARGTVVPRRCRR